MKTKKTLPILLAIIMVLGMLPTMVFATGEANRAPAVVSDQAVQTGMATPASDDGSTAVVPYTADMSPWFADADGDTLTYSVVSAIAGADEMVSSSAYSISDDTIIYTPIAEQASKTVAFTIKATDSQGADSRSNVTINVAVGALPANPPTLDITIDTKEPTDTEDIDVANAKLADTGSYILETAGGSNNKAVTNIEFRSGNVQGAKPDIGQVFFNAFDRETAEYSFGIKANAGAYGGILIFVDSEFELNYSISVKNADGTTFRDFEPTEISMSNNGTHGRYGSFRITNPNIDTLFPYGYERILTINVYSPGNEENGEEYTFRITRYPWLGFRLAVYEGEGISPEQRLGLIPAWPESGFVQDFFDRNIREISTNTTANKITIGLAGNTGSAIYGTGAKFYLGDEDKTAEYTTNNRSAGPGVVVDLDDPSYKTDDYGAYVPFSAVLPGLDPDHPVTTRTDYTLYVYRGEPSGWEITEQPEGGTFDKGDNPILSVETDAEDGELTYQWMRASSNGLNWTAISGATNSTYESSTVAASAYLYKCVLTDIKTKLVIDSDTVQVDVRLGKVNAPTIDSPLGAANNSELPYKTEYFVGEPINPLFINIRTNETQYVDYEFELFTNSENKYDGAQSIDFLKTDTSNNLGGTKLEMPESLPVGTYYFYCIASAVAKDEFADKDNPDNNKSSVESDIVKITVSERGALPGFDGVGAEGDPYLIKTVDHLNTIRDEVNSGNLLSGAYFAFANDITLPDNWKPIGYAGFVDNNPQRVFYPFSGILDGAGYTLIFPDQAEHSLLLYAREATIKNLNISGNCIDNYALVEDYCVDYGPDGLYATGVPRTITIDNVTIKSGTKTLYSGFIGGYASGANTIIIRNCTAEEGVVIGYDKQQSEIGTFAGQFNGYISNCVSYAEVYGVDSVGGLVGRKGQSMGAFDIINSAFLGSIEATGDRAGGIAAGGYAGASGTPVAKIQNCYVDAEITGGDIVGGILGHDAGHTYYNDTGDEFGIYGANAVSNNHFYGTIYAIGQNAGAIIGYLHDFSKTQGEATNFYRGGCGAANCIGGVVSGEIIGMERFSKLATAEEFANGTVLAKLNGSSTSLKNWIQGDKYPVHSNTAVLESLALSGNYKTDYLIGEPFNTDGMVVTATYSDNSVRTLTSTEVEFTGFDSSKRQMLIVTVKYGGVETSYSARVLYDSTIPKTNTVYFTLMGTSAHGDNGTTHTLAAGNLTTWLAQKAYTVDQNATVRDVIEQALNEAGGYTWINPDGNYIESITRNGVTLGEFTNGPLSGWMYTLNGTHPLKGIAEQFLSDGDVVVFHYTDDYTVDVGGGVDDVDTTELTALIAAANGKINSASIGDGRGQYPQTAVDALENAITTAQTAANNGALNQSEIDAATTDLDNAITIFNNSVITSGVTPAPKYKIEPVADDVYSIGETADGIKTMTVKDGQTGLKYFSVSIEPIEAHEGTETVVFTHFKDGIQLQLNALEADFDQISTAKAGFNVNPGDVTKVYIVDRLTNDLNYNPLLLQD